MATTPKSHIAERRLFNNGCGKRARGIGGRSRGGALCMDGQMPVMDGLEATRRIRELFDSQTLPIIGVTAHALATDRERFLASGMNGYLTKPIQREALKAEILRCLEEKDAYSTKKQAGEHPKPDSQKFLLKFYSEVALL